MREFPVVFPANIPRAISNEYDIILACEVLWWPWYMCNQTGQIINPWQRPFGKNRQRARSNWTRCKDDLDAVRPKSLTGAVYYKV